MCLKVYLKWYVLLLYRLEINSSQDGIDDKLEQTCDLNDVDDMIKQMLCELTSKELLYGPFKSLEEKVRFNFI